MKNFHQKLLLFLSVCLCGLCARQWYVQSLQRADIEKLEQTVFEKNGLLLAASNSVATMDHQISQMDSRITALKGGAQTDDAIIVQLKRDLAKSQASGDAQAAQIAEYKKAVDQLEAKLKESFDGIAKQNENTKQLVAQRDELAAKLNASVKDRNDVVAKYNDLVKQIEKNQAAGAGPPP